MSSKSLKTALGGLLAGILYLLINTQHLHAVIRQHDLAAWQTFDEMVEGVVKDATTSGLDGTLSAPDGPTLVEGKFGKSLSLDGTDDKVHLPATAKFNTYRGSISVWVKTALTGEQLTDAMIIYYASAPATSASSDGFGGDNEMHLHFRSDGKLEFFIQSDPQTGADAPTLTKNIQVRSTKAYNDGAWHHVVATWDAKAQEYHLFVDGSAEKRVLRNRIPRAFAASYSHIVGGPNNATKRLFNGQIDDLRLYSSVLTEADSNAIFAGDQGSILTSTSKVVGLKDQELIHEFTLNVDPKTITAEGLPAGLDLDAATKTISGTPTEGGSFDVTLTATLQDDSEARETIQFLLADGETNKLHLESGALFINSTTGQVLHGYRNIAASGEISGQESGNGTPAHAIDGIPGTISHSADAKAANFLELDLKAPKKLHCILILNRGDGSGGRLNKTVLKLLAADRTEVHAFAAITGAATGEMLTFVPPTDKETAQFVRLEKAVDDNHLHIAELKVYEALEGALGNVEPLDSTIVDGARVLTFDSIHLGKDVTIELQGNIPLSLRTLDGDITLATTLDASGGSGVHNNRSKALGRLGGAQGPEGRQWKKETYLRGNGPGAGYTYQNSGTGASHGGQGGRMLQRSTNSFEKRNPVPSIATPTYGDREVSMLLGGSSGGSSDRSGGGAGGGAIELAAGGSGKVTIAETGSIKVNGGNATGENNPSTGGGGAGGSIRLSGSEVHNHGLLSASGGHLARGKYFANPEGEVRGGNGGGGRIAIHSEGAVTVGNVNVAGGGTRTPGMESLDFTHGGIASQGTFAIIGGASNAINVNEGRLIIDTSSASWHHSGGSRGLGQLTEYTANLNGQEWKYKVASFELESIRIGREVEVILTGIHSLSLKTVENGGITIDSDLVANGGDAFKDVPNFSPGGRGSLGGYNGGPKDADNLGGEPQPSINQGEGPGFGSDGQYGGGGGGSGGRGGQGRGANGGERGEGYSDPLIEHLVGGSGGGGADAASGAAGGGAIELASGGILTLGGNIQVNGGKSSRINRMGGAGAGGSIKLSGTDVTIKGSLQANGGNVLKHTNTDQLAGAGAGGRIHIEHSGKLNIQPGAGGSEDLVAHYTFGEGSGRQTLDHVSGIPAGFSDDIKEENAWKNLEGAGFAPANALDLDGYKDYLTGRTASEYGIGGASHRTITCWVYARSFGNRRGVFHIGKFGTKNQDFSLCTNSTEHNWVLQLWGNDQGFWITDSKARWIHFAITYDGTEVKVFANGAEVAKKAADLNTPDNDALTIGAWKRGTNQYLEYFDGMIRDFRIYKRALAVEEVQAVMGGSASISTLAGADGRYGDAEAGNIVIVPKGGPTLELVGEATNTHEAGEAYPDPGAKALDAEGTEIQGAQVAATGVPDGLTLGEHIITYSFTDTEGRAAPAITRIVNVVDTTGPVMTLVGGDSVEILKGATYTDPGVTATDNLDTDPSVRIVNSTVPSPVDGLVLRFTFDDAANPLVDDISNKAITPKGEVAVTADDLGFMGKGLNFTGTDGSYAEIEAFESGGEMSVAGHVFLRKFNNWQRVFSLNDGNNGKNGIYLAQVSNGNSLRWKTTPGATIDTTFWEVEKWLHFVVSTDANDLKTVYKNGLLVHSRTSTGGTKATRQNNWLGRSSWSTNAYLDGILDNFMVFNRGLNSQEAYSLSVGKPSVDTSAAGEYTVTYDVIDNNNNQAQQVTRKVIVVEQLTKPQLTLNGDNPQNVEAGTAFTDPGATAKNPADDSILKADVSGTGAVDASTPGQYALTYSFSDAQLGEAVPVSRTVVVTDTTSPVLTLQGDAEITLLQSQPFVDPGVTAADSFDSAVQVISSAASIPNAVTVRGYNKRAQDADLDLSSADGIMSWVADGSALLREGPRNQGLTISGDPNFKALNSGITQDNDHSTLITGIFHARVEGEYAFGIGFEDDRGTLWLDLDQDGKFEIVGDQGGEHMNGGLAMGFSTVTLKPGHYRFAVAQTERSGWSGIQAVFMAPEGAGPTLMSNINPSDPAQDGLWATEPALPVDSSTPGEYTVTYTATDSSGNEAESITRKITVVADTEAPVITLAGEGTINHQLGSRFVDPGATATDNADGEISTKSSLGFPSEGLMGHWTFDDGTPADSSGNRHHGSNYGTPAYDDADIPAALAEGGGKSISFADGNHAIMVDTGGGQDVFNLPYITVSIWAKGLTGSNSSFISKEGENNRGWQIRRNGNKKNIESVWRVAGHEHTATGDILDDGEWHHIAASWDGRVRTVYIDGQVNVQSNAVGFIVPSNRLLVIGAKDNGGYGQPTTSWYNGKIDDVAIYNRALRPEEVEAIANGAAGLKINTAGTYTITYTATDSNGNSSTAERTVIVADDPNKPVITLVGDNPISMEIGSILSDPGVTVADAQGNSLDATSVQVTHDILTERTGENTIYYDFIDAQGRPARTVSRKVNIVDTTAPVITLNDRLPVITDQDIADNAPYSQAWENASNGGGNGFNPWQLTSNPNGGFAGFFIGDSKVGAGDINTNGKSFGLYGNSSPAASANADRTFTSPLSEGQTFSIQLAVNYRNGNKGIDLDKADGTSLWNFNAGRNPGTGEDDYSYADLVNGGGSISLGLEYQPDSAFTLTVTQKAGTKVGISITRASAAKGIEKIIQDVEFDLGAGIAGFGLYSAGTEGGDNNNLYANNIQLSSTPTGDDFLKVFVNNPFIDPGASAMDNSGETLHVSSSGSYPTGLIGRWTFDKENLDDLSPYGHNAVLVGGTYSDDTPSLLGGGKSMDLSQGNHYITINDASPAGNVFDSPNISVAFWVKDAKREQNWESFISKRGEGDMGWQVRFYAGTNRLSWSTCIIGSNVTYAPDNGINMADNQWRHVTATYDGKEKCIYINGVLRGRVNATGPIQPAPDNKLVIGARDTGPISRHSKSLIDEVALWNRALAPGEISGVMVGGSSVDTSTTGEYAITYSVIDSSGNLAKVNRTIEVIRNPSAPVISLNGPGEVTHEAGTPYQDEGASLKTGSGSPLEASLIIIKDVPDGLTPGIHVITFNYQDNEGNLAGEKQRIVHVVDTTAPLITLTGNDLLVIEKGTDYTEPGFSATDLVDGDTILAKSSRVTPDLLPAARFNVHGGSLSGLNDGDLIDQWDDSSSGGNKVDVKATGNKRPTYVAVATSLNNKPAVLFDNKMLKGNIGGSNDVLAQNVFVVASRNDTDTAGWRYLVAQDKDQRAIRSQNGKWHNGGNWNNFRAVNGNPGGQLRSNGTLIAGNNNTAMPAENTSFIAHSMNAKVVNYTNIVIGNFDDALGRGWKGHIGEVLIHGPLTNAEINAVGHDLATRYGVADTSYTDPLIVVDTATAGDYTITYTATDSSGNTSTATRTIRVVDDASQPILTLNGSASATLEVGTDFEDPGATVTAGIGGAVLNDKVASADTLDKNRLGVQTLSYNFTDGDGNAAQAVNRTVNIVDTTPPALTLVGDAILTVTTTEGFTEPGITASDNHTTEPVVTNSRTPIPNQLHFHGFQIEPQAAFFDFNNNGGLVSLVPGGTVLFTSGPGNRGMDFNSNGEFRNTNPGILITNRYMSLFNGEFNAKVNGEYEFGIKASADFAAFWLDLDQDGVFETAGEKGNERLNTDTGVGSRTVTLTAGVYRVAIAHGNQTGAPSLEAHFRTPAGAGPETLTIIKPSDAAQAGLWSTSAPAPFDANTAGEYTIVYTATDASGNTTSINRKVIIRGDETAPVITLIGEAIVTLQVGDDYVDDGATALDDVDGSITAFIDDNGTIDAVDTSKVGEYTITYDVADFSGNQATTVTRKVIVQESTPTDNFTAWVAGTGLAGLSADLQTLDADPDGDSLPNLMEYGFGTDPVTTNGTGIVPDTSTGSLTITFVRIKASVDADITYKVELTTTLSDWSNVNVSISTASDQSGLPDGKAAATSSYERVTASPTTNVAGSGGRQFLRLTVEK